MDARASHLLYMSFVCRFDFRLLVRSLVLRTLLYWAVVLLTSMSYPACPGIYVVMREIQIPFSFRSF